MTTTTPTAGESPLSVFLDAVDVLQDGFLILDRAWRFVYLNEAAARDLGRPASELVGAVLWEEFPDLLGTEAERAHRTVMNERVPLSIETRGPLGERWYRLRISPTRSGLSILWTDITERKRIEEELRRSEERFAAVHDRAPFAIALTSVADRRVVSVNDAFVALFGVGREALVGRTGAEIGVEHPGARAVLPDGASASVTIRELEVATSARAPEPRTLSVSHDRVAFGGGEYVLTTIQDVTDRRRAEDLLRERLVAQEQLARFAATVPGAICTFRKGPDGSVSMPFSAEALEDLYGLSRAELARDMSGCFALTDPEDVPHVLESIGASERTLTPWHAQFRYRHPTKGPRWIEGWSIPSRDPDGGTTWHGYVTDITDARRAQQALVDAERRATSRAAELQAVLDTVPAAVWIARDPRGDVIHGNRYAEELLGIRRGQNMSLSAPEAQRPANHHLERGGAPLSEDDMPIQRAARRGVELRDVEFDLVFADGTVRHLLGNATPLREDHTGGSVGAFIDITDRKRAEEQLRAEARRKDEFLAVLSHELRNPLAPIQNSIHLLERAAPGSEVAGRARSVLRRQADHLTRLVDDLLDVTRIARGKITLRVERVDLRDVARRTADDLHSLFEAAEVALRVEIPARPIWVDADPTRMAQVVGNLLNNAAKFTPRGGDVVLAVSAEAERVELRVADSGPGIAPEQQLRLFQPFAQAEQGLARTRGGLGLGLAIVKGMVELHGGSVAARSLGPGQGAEFVVALPLAAAPASRPGSRDARGSAPRDVLIIEDNADAGTSLRDMLALEGIQVRIAREGRAGLAMARERVPDVVLCDIGLPDIDGYEVARAMRANPSLKGVRLVALTGYAQPEDVARANAAGFDAHVSKPPAPRVLSRAMADGADENDEA